MKIEIRESNAGDIALLYDGFAILMDEREDALTDCRMIDEWVEPVGRRFRVNGYHHVTDPDEWGPVVATYYPADDRMEVEPVRGCAADSYLASEIERAAINPETRA